MKKVKKINQYIDTHTHIHILYISRVTCDLEYNFLQDA